MTPSNEVVDDDAGRTRHIYPASAMVGDYMRAAAGLVPTGLLFATVPIATVPATLLGGFAAVFAVFGLRTLLRHGTSIEMTETGLRAQGASRVAIAWAELDRLKLSYYSTRRDRRSGWMQLELRAGGARLTVDSRIAGFDEVVRRAAAAAAARHLELSESTVANLEAVGLSRVDYEADR